MQHKLLHPSRLFLLFKLVVFSLLAWNLWLFLMEDLDAAAVRLGEGAGAASLIEVFAQSIDTGAWIVLLLLFELETSYLPDSYLRRRRVKWSLHGLRALCALVIAGSVIGYAEQYETYVGALGFAGSACEHAGAGWSLLTTFEEFEPLTAANCAVLAGGALQFPGEQVLIGTEVHEHAVRQALTNVVNAVAWVLVVVLLEFDVRLQLRGMLQGWILRVSTALKALTYATLLAAAIYWGIDGAFIDFWDAFLWLVAFVFIEMNLFQWQREVRELERLPVVRR